jgi:hypothetical protein
MSYSSAPCHALSHHTSANRVTYGVRLNPKSGQRESSSGTSKRREEQAIKKAIKRYEISDPEKQMPRPLGRGVVGRCDEAANLGAYRAVLWSAGL